MFQSYTVRETVGKTKELVPTYAWTLLEPVSYIIGPKLCRSTTARTQILSQVCLVASLGV